MDTLDAPPRTVTLSASAARRLAEIIAAEGNPALMLRLAVSGGGCSGFQYGFALDATLNDDDRVFERDGVKLVVDEVSLDLLAGSEVEYDEGLMAAHFTVRNPNATASCGCGTSFSV
ncbi:iron-sulfur cluster insertion protein ErpA [Elioraea tepidiphila]|jgi:iron-sulfur cluster insertion protein|uniref:iron-sulfur cluster insertion protein ErpA n=1 Tax=Elioraea tepidiphila TaxID=457934 RepID=UPI00036987DE|nr:iron-sulfur cluster insertion protein ErpA [Elioraea tepidiphila]